MPEIQRTLAFVAVAVVSLLGARFSVGTFEKSNPAYSDVGKEFYPNFDDPNAARELQVVAYNADTAESRVFGIQCKDGLWRIPSRHNYPVDGKDRLAKCATSILHLKREMLASPRATDHPEYEVVDPLDENSESLKRGQRITLKNEAGEVLADYIVGKADPNRSGSYYIRRPDEAATYIAKLELQLSTKFADWIEPDLLKVDGFKLTGVTIDNYSVDTERGRIVGREQNVLSRKTSSDPWKLDKLDEATEEVNQDEVRKLVNALDDLKIVGVRPKPLKLQRDLRVDKGLRIDQNIAADLGMKGFFFAETPDGDQQLVSKEGDVIARTDQGVEYLLHFGEVFSGSEQEIEFGFAKADDAAKPADGEPAKDADPKKPADTKQRSRYLFVTTQLNPEALGPKPETPVKPEPIGDAPAGEAPVRQEGEALSALDLDNVGPWAEYNEKKRIYDALLAKFESDTKAFAANTAAYEEKVKAAEKLVKELNTRFADWYYVISAESFENLRQGRKTLVKPKSAAGTNPAAPPGGGLPNLPF